ncbi:hypothetical protein JCM8097_005614 [Rhodosporidiobolus ruineniae]
MPNSASSLESAPTVDTPLKRVWYRSTWWAALALGLCNFAAPGIWGAMNGVGAGGAQTPFQVAAANSLTFGLMVLTAFSTSALCRVVGVKWTLFLGAAGYAPYAAGLYLNNLHGTAWLLLLGAALCGLSAGTFWSIEAAVALSYPEPHFQGRFLGLWLSFRVLGNILGGCINLGLNVDRNTAGSINPKVYLVFIAIQAAGPFAAFLLPSPSKVQRTDGLPVRLFVNNPVLKELKETLRLFFTKRFLLIVPLIFQAVFSESFNSTFITLHYSVRVRALGSLLSAICCITAGNLFGRFVLDRASLSLKTRTRLGFYIVLGSQGLWWIWSLVMNAYFRSHPKVYDWDDANWGAGFGNYLFIAIGFQLNYMYLYHVVGTLVVEPADIVRIAGLLRGTESAAQAISYGLNSLSSMQDIGSAALNTGLWLVSLYPAWLVVRKIGVEYFGRTEKETREREELDAGRVGGGEEKKEGASALVVEKGEL